MKIRLQSLTGPVSWFLLGSKFRIQKNVKFPQNFRWWGEWTSLITKMTSEIIKKVHRWYWRAKTVYLAFWIMLKKKAQFHQKRKKRVEHRLLIKCPFLTFQISAADARERNHRMTNFRDCWFQTEKPKSFCPVFELMWHKNPIIFYSA